jgi:hypothetical protein
MPAKHCASPSSMTKPPPGDLSGQPGLRFLTMIAGYLGRKGVGARQGLPGPGSIVGTL